MPTLKLKCPLHDSYRVQQIGGMFDVTIGTIHPGMVQSLVKDPKWHLRETKENYDRGRKNTVILGRRIAFFEYW